MPIGDIPSAEVIVVLGGGTEPQTNPRPTVELNGAGDRIIYAAKLYHTGKAAHILLSGGNINLVEGIISTPASQMAEIIKELGVPSDALWIEDRSRNTYENALYAQALLREKGFTRVILVTSAAHMPRSVALFTHQGIEVIPAPTDFSVTESGWQELFSQDPSIQLMNILPNVSNLSMTTNIMKEYIGMVIYHIQGWM